MASLVYALPAAKMSSATVLCAILHCMFNARQRHAPQDVLMFFELDVLCMPHQRVLLSRHTRLPSVYDDD